MAVQPDVVRDRQIQAQVQAQPQSGDGKSSSRTVTDTIIGKPARVSSLAPQARVSVA